MVAEEFHGQIFLADDEPAAHTQTGATLENIATEFSNAEARVGVRVAKLDTQIKQREQRVDGVFLGQFAQPLLHVRA